MKTHNFLTSQLTFCPSSFFWWIIVQYTWLISKLPTNKIVVVSKNSQICCFDLKSVSVKESFILMDRIYLNDDFISSFDGFVDMRFYVGQKQVQLRLDVSKGMDVEKVLNEIFEAESIPSYHRIFILSAVHKLIEEECRNPMEESMLGEEAMEQISFQIHLLFSQ